MGGRELKYSQEDIYLAFCNLFRNAELSKRLHVELCRRMDVGPHSTLFREMAGRVEGMGAWFSWASAEPLDASLVREMAGSEVLARVLMLDGVSIFGLPQEKVRRETAERCTIFQREGGHVTADDPRIVRLEERHLPLLEGLFDHPDTTQYQRDIYSSAYETILRAADTEELKCAVFGFLSEGRLLAAIQVSTTNYATINFQRTMLINPFTRPDHRGKGYGKALMNHVLGLYPGQTVAYEYDGENEAAAKLAAACGFLPVLNIDLYTLDLL
jgi:GNAT superfamily N-acetyltransferase